MNLCGLVRCDNVIKIKYKALVALRNILPMTSKCMVECVSKNLVSNHNLKKSYHQLQRERYGLIFDTLSNSFNEDKNFKSFENNKNLLIENFSLQKRSHHGTFIDILEVEFCQIRTAAIDTLYSIVSSSFNNQNTLKEFFISKLEGYNDELFNNACDLLIDSINDSVSNVRFEAIKKLTSLMSHNHLFENFDNLTVKSVEVDSNINKISKNVKVKSFNSNNKLKLSDYQLYATLDALSDVSFDIRKEIYYLLMNSKLSSSLSLYSTILALNNNLKTYTCDKILIWQCCQQLGLKHGSFAPAMIYTLFGFHPFYINLQPLLSDDKYIANAIFAFNAAYVYPPLISLLPSFSFKHYTFLRNLYPKLVPYVCFNDKRISDNQSKKISIFDISKSTKLLQEQVLKNFQDFFTDKQKCLFACLKLDDKIIKIDFKLVSDFETWYKKLNEINKQLEKVNFDNNYSIISHKLSYHINFFNILVLFSQFVKMFVFQNAQNNDLEYIKSIIINSVTILSDITNLFYKYDMENNFNHLIFVIVI